MNAETKSHGAKNAYLAIAGLLFAAAMADADNWSGGTSGVTYIDNAQVKVGIGLPNPTNPFQIRRDLGTASGEKNWLYFDQNSSSSPAFSIGYRVENGAGTRVFLGPGNNKPLDFRTSGNPQAMTLSNEGRLGIGVTDPQYTLDIASQNSSQLRVKSPNGAPLIKLSGAYNEGNGAEFWQDASGIVRLNLNSSYTAVRLGLIGDVTANRFTTNSSYNQAMFTSVSADTRFLELRDGGGNVKAFIDPASSGNIAFFSQKMGIGIDAPTARLQVEDFSAATGQLLKTTINYGGGVTASHNSHELVASYGSGSTGNLTGLKVSVSHAGSGKSYAAIFRGGRVGIGTDNPNFDLEVDGTARIASTLEVGGIKTKTWTVAPDYVFEKGYKLASLQEVESYVQKNKHLPEVPSAKVIKEKGLDLAEMNLLLLKKVEELTLHAIRQEKEMKRQAEEIRSLKSVR